MGSVPCVRGHRPELPRGGLPFISQRTSLDTVIQPWAFDGFQLYPATRPGSGTPARCLPRLVLFSQHTSLWPFLFLTAAHMRPALRSSRNRYLPLGAESRHLQECWAMLGGLLPPSPAAGVHCVYFPPSTKGRACLFSKHLLLL